MDLVRPAVQRASQPLTMKPFEWEKQLRIACSLYRNYYWKKEKYGMELNRENRDRSYLYGRLLAVADKIERAAQYGSGAANKGEGGEEGGRPTNAWRYMVAFSLRPYKTWSIIHDALNPYMLQLEQKKPQSAAFYQNELMEIKTAFVNEEAYSNNQPLEGSYLLGFYCQRKALRKGKENIDNEDNE